MVKDVSSTFTLDQRVERALQLHTQGYNCSQAVMLAFNDITGLDDTLAAAISASFGGGLSGSGLTCGAVSAMSMVKGMTRFHSPANKKDLYRIVKIDVDEFARRNDGLLLCRDLRQPGRKSCRRLIADAVEICHYSIFNAKDGD